MFTSFFVVRIVVKSFKKELMPLFQIKQMQWPKKLILDDIQKNEGRKEVGYRNTTHS